VDPVLEGVVDRSLEGVDRRLDAGAVVEDHVDALVLDGDLIRSG